MKSKLSLISLATTVTLILGVVGVVALPAYAHDGEDHGVESEAHTVVATDTDEIAQKQALLNLLVQLVELLQQKAAMEASMSMDEHSAYNKDHDDATDAGLVITVEVHGEKTHVHVYMDGEQTDSFFIDADINDESAVYAAIAAETDFIVADIEAAATINHPEEAVHDEYDDEEMNGSHSGMDLSSIHIMGDGTVMLGNGTALTDATVTAAGMIVLGDGSEVEAELDLR